MKIIIAFLITILMINFTTAQTLQWAKGIGSGAEDTGNSIVVDSAGNVLTVGTFFDTVDFDPGPGVYNLTSAAGDIYIQKLDNAGNFLWAKNLGGLNYPTSSKLKIDQSGNLYILRSFYGITDFDPSPAIYNLTASGVDVAMLKLDSTGNFIWAKKVGGASNDLHSDFFIDADNNLFYCGSFAGTADFDPGAGIFNLVSAGSGDIFISKLDSNGFFQWAKRIGGSSFDSPQSITMDNTGNIYYTGYFSNTVDFNPGAGSYALTSAGSQDAFISKLDNNGNFIWARRIGGSGGDGGVSVTLDNAGKVYTSGNFSGTVDFNPGAGVFNITSGSTHNTFILKLDEVAGNFIWAKSISSNAANFGISISTDNSGNTVTAGSFYGMADFDPGIGTCNFTSAGGKDIYLLKLNANGDFIWSQQIGGIYDESANALTMRSDTLFATGSFAQSVDFDPGVPLYNLSSMGGSDIFVSKYIYCGFNYNVNYDACDSVFLFGKMYTAAADTLIKYSDIYGCDSNEYAHIHIYPTHTFLTQTACDSFTLNAQTYTSSGTYVQTLLNAIGCDSVITLELIVNYSGSSYILQQAYDSFTLNGQTYFNSGVYTQIMTNMVGCDSLITLDLTINPYTPCASDITINSSPYVNYLTESQTWIVTSGTVLIPFGTYAKLDADIYNYITLNPGFKADHGSVFIAQAFNGCFGGGPLLPQAAKKMNADLFASNEIVLYPNPTSGMIHIEHDEKLTDIQIFDMVGKLIINQKCAGEIETNIDLSSLPNGVYHVKAAGYNSIKVIKNN